MHKRSFIMKKIKFLIVALFAVLICANLASCSKDDDGPEGGNESYSLVGKWIDDDGTIYEFAKDNTFKEYYDLSDYPHSYDYGTWKITSSNLIMTYKGYVEDGYNEPYSDDVWSPEIKWTNNDSFRLIDQWASLTVKRFN